MPTTPARAAAPFREGRRDHALLLTMILTAIRVPELDTLRITDITPTTGAHIRIEGKGRKRRTVTLTRETVAILRQWLKECQGQPEDPLFPQGKDKPLIRYGVTILLSKHTATATASCSSLKGKRITPHELRHTNAMLLRAGGVDIATIALRLGHDVGDPSPVKSVDRFGSKITST